MNSNVESRCCSVANNGDLLHRGAGIAITGDATKWARFRLVCEQQEVPPLRPVGTTRWG